ncbi:uncharacterized protein LOC133532811 isoform X1 [Cydia pomonella]|uniref:uncharacterized protein LOC133532811 isoform X1 n=1 Tax=Cydia pomonella TaxID=82600 RepID=UPI002ADE2CDB|nr:uncharacterized protein LOC133532811 isoform X1 [Cydia pomonella]
MKFLTLGLLLMCGVPLIAHGAPDKPALRIPSNSKDWIRKEVSAIIHMTLEFVKDMDLKMRDVRRIERYYYGTMDFGAGRIYTAIGNKFDHMCSLYKNTSQISYIIEQERNLRSDVVGMLQFMCESHTHTHAHTHARTHARTHAHAHTHTHTHAREHIYTHSRVHTHTKQSDTNIDTFILC